MSAHRIVGIHITNRVQNASQVQKILTEYGCSIKTRLGLHDVSTEFCSPSGLLLLELAGNPSECEALVTGLKSISGLDVQEMSFRE